MPDEAAVVFTKRAAHCEYNFGPASTHDEIVFTSERPGGDPDEDGEIKDATVVKWVNFMKDKGITDVLILLEDNELETYESPGLMKMYEREGLVQHRAPMGKPGACDTAMSVINDVKAKSGKVVAHCTHGMGRSGRIAAGWLVTEYGLTAQQTTDEAIRLAEEIGMEQMGAPHLLEKWLGCHALHP